MKKQKGFTLIELLVVIAIIGILISVVVSGVKNINYQKERQHLIETGQIVDTKPQRHECEQYGHRSINSVPVKCIEYFNLGEILSNSNQN